jgi:hypothetical protein
MKKNCLQCETPFQGREDKRFCSAACKNKHFNILRKTTNDTTSEIDAYLHRNHQILATLMGEERKVTLDKLVLVRTGFKFEYMTGIYFNKENKMYRLVYDFAWMDFYDQKILIIQKARKEQLKIKN